MAPLSRPSPPSLTCVDRLYGLRPNPSAQPDTTAKTDSVSRPFLLHHSVIFSGAVCQQALPVPPPPPLPPAGLSPPPTHPPPCVNADIPSDRLALASHGIRGPRILLVFLVTLRSSGAI
ncbi:hypothetical protein EYF80_011525 [Liparis tanakae]|uniref:Uncharacterized protein n=1 Tax=Liparis tanakae TaxID=230148 RepID=A0A4Z2IKF0_9TELE|nr:hypothetical protein EYF80_011525 [Liparis tanakae]